MKPTTVPLESTATKVSPPSTHSLIRSWRTCFSSNFSTRAGMSGAISTKTSHMFVSSSRPATRHTNAGLFAVIVAPTKKRIADLTPVCVNDIGGPANPPAATLQKHLRAHAGEYPVLALSNYPTDVRAVRDSDQIIVHFHPPSRRG